MKCKFFCFTILFICFTNEIIAQNISDQELRGTINQNRSWWNVLRYDINFKPNIDNKTIKGFVVIKCNALENGRTMQIDLQQPLTIDSIFFNDIKFCNKYEKSSKNTYLIELPFQVLQNNNFAVKIFYGGTPRAAVKPPWDGGFSWSKDNAGKNFISASCQGLGASVWYPCKDHQSDEPDNGSSLTCTVPKDLKMIGNGRLIEEVYNNDNTTTFNWEVKNPINNYNIIPYIGNYVPIKEIYKGEKGNLDLCFWALKQDEEKAKKSYEDIRRTIKAFEWWFGPYPFYEDGYQLVQAPYLGMEHQSAVAYGNKFMQGYLGQDLSYTGWGLKWDYIIVHETGHEWFANNITTNDICDMWVHEGLTTYSEVLFTEFYYGKNAGDEYLLGIRNNIQNDKNIEGPKGVNEEGSGDMYPKGANIMHTIRTIMNNDSNFRKMLRGMNSEFYHKTIDGISFEKYIAKQSGLNLTSFFNQYLRTTSIPNLKIKQNKNKIEYYFDNCNKDFSIPIRLVNDDKEITIYPTTKKQLMKIKLKNVNDISISKNYYITTNLKTK